MISWVPTKPINDLIVSNLLKTSLKTNQFTNYGPNVQLLENTIRDKFCVNKNKAVIVVNNGSIAIHILAVAIQFVNDKTKLLQWATQSFTFPPSAQANLQNVFIVDSDLDGGIDLSKVDITTTNGIIVTNIFGNVVDIEKYEHWANTYDKFLIFDNAATCFTFYKGQNCINYGVGCGISFHHTKPFGFGEGGAIIVDTKYESTVRSLINFGINLTDDYYVKEGTNGKMSDISATYILQYWNLQFDKIVQQHSALYNYFKQQSKSMSQRFTLFSSFHDSDKIVPACINILFNNSNDSENINKLMNETNIHTRKYYHPIKATPNSQYIYDHILCIPCTIDMTKTDVDYILCLISNYFV